MVEVSGGAAGETGGGCGRGCRGRPGDRSGAAPALAQRLCHILHYVPNVARVQHRPHRRVALP